MICCDNAVCYYSWPNQVRKLRLNGVLEQWYLDAGPAVSTEINPFSIFIVIAMVHGGFVCCVFYVLCVVCGICIRICICVIVMVPAQYLVPLPSDG